MPEITLRPLTVEELPIVWRHMNDPESAAMGGLPLRPLDVFVERWSRLLADPQTPVWAIVLDGEIIGNAGLFGPTEVGYWVDRDYWGRGIASRALTLLLELIDGEHLIAHVRAGNVASLRVLAKHGFVESSRGTEDVWLELVR